MADSHTARNGHPRVDPSATLAGTLFLTFAFTVGVLFDSVVEWLMR
jgi:hypothetical protein